MKSVIEQSETAGEHERKNSESATRGLTKGQALQVVWPYALGVSAAIAVTALSRRLPTPREIKDVFIGVSATAGVVAGFMLTAASILTGLADRPFIRSAKRAGVYTSLVANLFSAMRWCIAATVVSLPALLFNPDWKLAWYPFALGVWSFISFTALGASVRALTTFTKLMNYVAEDQ